MKNFSCNLAIVLCAGLGAPCGTAPVGEQIEGWAYSTQRDEMRNTVTGHYATLYADGMRDYAEKLMIVKDQEGTELLLIEREKNSSGQTCLPEGVVNVRLDDNLVQQISCSGEFTLRLDPTFIDQIAQARTLWIEYQDRLVFQTHQARFSVVGLDISQVNKEI